MGGRRTCGVQSENESEEERQGALVSSAGKLALLHKMLVQMRADGHRVLIFSQVRALFRFQGAEHRMLDPVTRVRAYTPTVGSAARCDMLAITDLFRGSRVSRWWLGG